MRSSRPRPRPLTAFFLGGVAAIAAPAHPAPARERVTEPFVGVRLTERYLDDPRPLSVRLLEIDPAAGGVRFAVTPREPGLPNGDETTTQTTTAFVERVGAQMGFNGSFFRLEHHSEQRPTDNLSLVVSDGDAYSPWDDRMPHALAIGRDGRPSVVSPVDGDAFLHAVAGNVRLLDGGEVLPRPDGREPGTARMNDLHPRTAAGVTADGHLLVVTVDGRQPGFSEGLYLDELAALLLEEGAVDAVNLDGGGSTTLVADLPGDAHGPLLLNSPVGRGPVGTQRNNGVNLAVFAEPRETPDVAEHAAGNGRVLAGFEEGEGGFTGDFESGSTSGVDTQRSSVDRVRDDAAAGRGAQRLAVTAAEPGGRVEVRLLSHGGVPALNEPFEPVARISLFVRNVGASPVLVAPIVDDTDGHERGTPRSVPADLAWHEFAWDLADAGDWDSFACANGRLDAAEVTLDSFWASGDGGFVLLWDQLAVEPAADR